jgi:hypothetical protein
MASWESEWKAAKTAFEAKTGQKKPSAPTMLAIKKGSGLEEALRNCDAAFAAIGSEKDAAKRLALVQKFSAAAKVFDAKAAAYEKILVATIAKADIKLVQPELTILWKHIYTLGASLKIQLVNVTKVAQSAKGEDVVFKNLLVSLNGAVVKAKAFAAKVTAAKVPTGPTVFNAGIAPAGRGITAHAGHFERLKAKGFEFPHGYPANLFKIMEPWAQNQRKLAANATPDLVKREVGAFLQAVAGMEKWAKG